MTSIKTDTALCAPQGPGLTIDPSKTGAVLAALESGDAAALTLTRQQFEALAASFIAYVSSGCAAGTATAFNNLHALRDSGHFAVDGWDGATTQHKMRDLTARLRCAFVQAKANPDEFGLPSR